MGHIPEEIIEEIRQKSDIVDVISQFLPLKKRGQDFWGCCPFHQERTPSFKVNSERGAYYCFGCKAHGTVIDFVKASLNTDFPGALHWLADRYGILIPETNEKGLAPSEAQRRRQLKEKRQALLESAAKWYHSLLNSPEAQPARDYLNSRGLDSNAIEQFQLGYSPDSWDGIIRWATAIGYDTSDLLATGLVAQKENNSDSYDRFRGRLMFPIWNENGKVCGFSARVLDPEAKTAKYVNSPETDFFQKGQLLYALNFARPKLKEFGYALICEGQLDVISCHRAGLHCAVAAEGTAFTEQHAHLLAKSVKKVVLCFDADTAGYKASQRTITLLHGEGLEVSVVTLPEGEDPDSVFRKGGASALRSLMSNPEQAIPYLYRVISTQAGINAASPEGKSIIARTVLTAIRPIADPVVSAAHCQWLADALKLPERIIQDELATIQTENRRNSPYNARTGNAAPATAPRGFQEVRRKTPPAYLTPPSQDTRLWMILLDLLLQSEAFIPPFKEELDQLTSLPDSPLGIAIGKVLIAYDEDEWNSIAQKIQNTESLFQDDSVAKVLLDSEYALSHVPEIAPDAQGDALQKAKNERKQYLAARQQKMNKAFQDCLFRLKLLGFDQKISDRKKQLDQETDEEKRRTLNEEISRLLSQKNQFRISQKNPSAPRSDA